MQLLYMIIYIGLFTTVCTEDDVNISETDSVEYEEDVMILTDKNFKHVIKENKNVLVEFYAPWCGHCQQLKPEYAKAATELKPEGIVLAMVDATTEKELATTFEINGFPTLKFFKNGEFLEDFDGMRDANGIMKYSRERSDPNYKPPPSKVKSLTKANFKEFVDKHDLSLVEFYAPWCGHCKSLAPEYEKASADLKSEGIPLAKVDAVEEKDLATEYSVSGFPTLYVFRNGKRFDYKGPRHHYGIVNYMKEQSKSPSSLIEKISDAKSNIPKRDIAVFAYFDGQNNLFEAYIDVANDKRGHNAFLHTFSKEVADKYDLKINTVNVLMPEVYQSKYEDKIKSFSKDSASKSDLLDWLNEKLTPLVGQRTSANSEHLYTKRPLLVVYYDVDFGHQHVKATQIVRNKILPLADEHRELTFAVSNEEDFLDEMKSIGLDDSGEEINAAIFADGNMKYKLEPDDEFDENVLQDFILKFMSGKLKPYLKSQAIPKKQEGPVFTLVAKNFEKEVLESGKDFLVEFYAPWCGHCKKLEPVYKKIAKHFAARSDHIVIAKMDAVANTVLPDFKVAGFPTIYFVKSNDVDNPVLFEGSQRTFEELKEFVEAHSSFISAEKEEL